MLRKLFIFICLISCRIVSFSQNLSYTCPRDTILGCNTSCLNISASFPDIRALTSDYIVTNVSTVFQCRPYIDPGSAGPSANINNDDVYSAVINIPFNFVFYGKSYNQLIISPNGVISFDISKAGAFAHFASTLGNLPNTGYDRSIVMGLYHDLDIREPISPNRKIKYNTIGNAPNRKWILSFYKMPLFYNGNGCNVFFENTHQIILHESSGIVEVHVISRQPCTAWQDGRGMIGIQDSARTRGVMPPLRGATDPLWGTINMNESWRFIPKNGASLYRSVQLLDGSGNVVATGDTSRINTFTLGVTFNNICPPSSGTNIYVVKTTYQKIDDPNATFFSLDTIRVVKQAQLPLSATASSTNCGTSFGSITANSFGGTGQVRYSLDSGVTLQNSNVFNNLAAGTYTVYAVDASGCSNYISVTVTSISSLNATFAATPTSCPGVSNGTVTVSPTTGTAPYTFVLDNTITQTGNGNFTNLSPGAHTIVYTDANNCSGTVSFNISSLAQLSFNSLTSSTSCPGVSNGSISITPTSGTGPYEYGIGQPPVFQISNTFTGLSATQHAITIRDALGCTGVRNVFIGAGPSLSATVNATTATCAGNDGSITITMTNGNAPYTATLTNSATGQIITLTLNTNTGTISNLSAGTYTLEIKDVNNCSRLSIAAVNSSSGVTGTASFTSASCPGVNNGTITVTPAGGSSPYSYSLDGGPAQSSNVFTAVAAGPHNVSFTDANGCVGNVSVNVTPGTAIAATVLTSSTSCNNLSDGSITINTVGGTAPFSFSLDGGTAQPSNIFNSISFGPHTINFTDANGCSGSVNTNVAQGPALTATATSSATSCPTANNGSILINPNSGTGPYTYSLDNGPVQSNNLFTNVSAGAHIIAFTDANGCTGTVTSIVSAGTVLTGIATPTATSCDVALNGTILISPQSGTGPFSFTLDGGLAQPDSLFTGLSAGPHNGSFTDINGCTGTVTTVIAAGPAITGTVSPNDASCSSAANGSITVTPSSGTAPFSYALNGGTNQSSAIFAGIAPGNYNVSFTDSYGCSATLAVAVGAGPDLTGTASSTSTSCPGVNDGTVTTTVNGGITPLSYSIDGGPSQTSNIFTGIAASNHTVTFTDAAGCSGSTIITVNQGNNLSSTINVTDPPCAFINNGIITVTPTSGTGPYEFSLDGINFQLSDSFVSLPPGNYNISIRNSIGCTGSNSATLNTNSAITVSAIITPPLCSGDNSGTITITASGGLAPFEYSIDAGNNYQSSVQFSNLSAGAYTVRTRDNAGCTKDTLLTLADPPVLSISASSSPASCAGGDGTITITTNGGTPGYSYSINNGVNFSPNNIFTVADGNYPAIIVRDNNSCIAQTSVIVDRTDNMVLTLEPSDTVVCAESQVILQPVTNDPGNTNFNWSSPNAPANTIADPNVRNATIRPVDTSIYIVRAQWGICERTDSITFYILEKPVANAGRDSAICFDQRVVSLQGSASNTSGSVNFSWSPAAGVYSPNSASSFAEIDASTLFTLTVTDNYGCNFAVTDQVTMTKQPPVPANAGRDTIAIKGQPHQLAATGGATYLWSPAALLNNPSSDQPLATLQNDTRFTVIVTDAAGCVGSDTVFVKVYEGPAYYVPNAFSPNGDGLNDIFRPVPVGMVNTEFFRVFNRYGEIIFETNKWMQGWDGNYKGRPQPVGTYVWVVKGTDRNGNITEAKGTVVLIR